MSPPDDSAYRCRICRAATNAFDSESKDDRHYTIVECNSCGTIQVCEHYEAVSPDYVHLTLEDLGPSHIWMNREHKHDAYRQFMALMQDIGGLGPDTVIVDVGCGTGGFGEYCRQHGLRYIGCDASAAQVEYAVTCGLDVVRADRLADFTSLDGIPTDTTVVFTLWDVLEHVREPNSVLSDIARKGFRNTYVFISVPNGGALRWKKMMYRALGRKLPYLPWEHVFYYTPRSLKLLLQSCGFDETASGAVKNYPRPLSFGEIVRRAGFAVLGLFPSIAPQIYALARLEAATTAHSTRPAHRPAQ